MIQAQVMARRFEEIVGWPYVSPGTDDANGIDCSGAFVRAYRLSGLPIYHGSNRIIREYCKNVFRITDANQLKVGMPVFKGRDDGAMSEAYKPGGKYYRADLPLNYYHIGLVVSTQPLEIIHATTPCAKRDTKLGTWLMAGYLNAVDYSVVGGVDALPDEDSAEGVQIVEEKKRVTAPSGSTVNLRKRASDKASVAVLARVPIGEIVYCQAYTTEWTKVMHNGISGYMKACYLSPLAEAEETPQAEATGLEARVRTVEEWCKQLEDRVCELEGTKG